MCGLCEIESGCFLASTSNGWLWPTAGPQASAQEGQLTARKTSSEPRCRDSAAERSDDLTVQTGGTDSRVPPADLLVQRTRADPGSDSDTKPKAFLSVTAEVGDGKQNGLQRAHRPLLGTRCACC